jgi:hypothetical protein
MRCPFCDEDGFDAIGLLTHLRVPEWCPRIKEIEQQARDEEDRKRKEPPND